MESFSYRIGWTHPATITYDLSGCQTTGGCLDAIRPIMVSQIPTWLACYAYANPVLDSPDLVVPLRKLWLACSPPSRYQFGTVSPRRPVPKDIRRPWYADVGGRTQNKAVQVIKTEEVWCEMEHLCSNFEYLPPRRARDPRVVQCSRQATSGCWLWA